MIGPQRLNPFSTASTSGSTASTSGSTAQNSNFVDEKFEVIQAPAEIKNPSDEQHPSTATYTLSAIPDDYTEEDVMFLTESIASLPSIFLEKIPLRTQAQLTPFNHQFYRYCKKKGINPFEYFFDEFGLVVSGLGLAGGIWRDYKAAYGTDSRRQMDKKLSSDYDHAKELAEKKENDIQDGKVTGAQP